ncbi:hypothetical protein MOSE0_M05468 [Monosporozyma servazzii]
MSANAKDCNPLPVYNHNLANDKSRDDSNNKNIPGQTKEYFLRGNTTSPINEYGNINKTEHDSKVSKQKEVLNAYIYDFLLKSKHNDTANSFYNEANIVEDGNRPIRVVPDVHVPPAFIPKFNTKQSYLFEWWLIFWDVFNSKSNRDGSALSQNYYQILLMQRQFEQGFRNVAVNAARQQFLAESNNEFKDESLNVIEFLSMLSPEKTGNIGTSNRVATDSNQISTNSPMAGSLQAHLAEQRRFMQALQQQQQQQQFQNQIPRKVTTIQQSPYPYLNRPPYQHLAPVPVPNSQIPYSEAPQMNMYMPSPDPTPIPHNFPIQMGVPQPNMPHPNFFYSNSAPSSSSTRQYPHYYEPHSSRSHSQLNRMNSFTQQQLYEQELLKEQYQPHQRMQLQRAKSSPAVSDKRDHYPGSVITKTNRSTLVPILENQSGEKRNSSIESTSNVAAYKVVPDDSNNKIKSTKGKNKLKKAKHIRKPGKKNLPHSTNVLNKQKEPNTDNCKSETITRRPTTMSQIFGNSGRRSQRSSVNSSVSLTDNLKSNSSVDSDKLISVADQLQTVSDPASPWGYGINSDHQQQRNSSSHELLRQVGERIPPNGHHQTFVPEGSKFSEDLIFQNNGTTMESVNREPSLMDIDNANNQNIVFGPNDDTFKCDDKEDLLFFDNIMSEASHQSNQSTDSMQKHGNSHTSHNVIETTKSNNSDSKSSHDYQQGNMLDMDPSQFFDHYSN